MGDIPFCADKKAVSATSMPKPNSFQKKSLYYDPLHHGTSDNPCRVNISEGCDAMKYQTIRQNLIAGDGVFG